MKAFEVYPIFGVEMCSNVRQSGGFSGDFTLETIKILHRPLLERKDSTYLLNAVSVENFIEQSFGEESIPK